MSRKISAKRSIDLCGISGVLLRGGETADEKLLRQMAQAMSRRGPDAEGVFFRENLGVSHRRLKIIDLSNDANQPMFDRSGKIGIVYNGEIYNFQELRETLIKKGYRFKNKSDSEVIIYAYLEWGEASFSMFNGIFAIGLWDWRGPEPILYLVRDRFGTKPLFYYNKYGRLAFASELKPLLEVPWIDKTLDRSALFAYLTLSHVPCPLSILSDVKQVSPAHFIRIDSKGVRDENYLNIGGALPNDKSRELLNVAKMEEDYLAELEGILRRAMARQVISDVPVGFFLSGGIDSSLMIMAHEMNSGIRAKTFSIGYEEKEFDETPYAREAASIFGTDHYEMITKPSDYFDLIPDIPLFFDQPMADPTLLSSLLLSRMAKKHVTVCLSGDGGDELFFGYTYQKVLLDLKALRLIPSAFRTPVFNGFAQIFRGWATLFKGESAQRFRKICEIFQFKDDAELFQYFIGMIGPMRLDRVASLLKGDSHSMYSIYSGISGDLKGMPWSEVIEQVFIRTFMLDTVLAKTDRASMAYGLEARVPFLDNEVVDFAARLPFHMKLRQGTSKYILRTLLRKEIQRKGASDLLCDRKKQGFSIPMRDWLRGELRYLVDEYLNPKRLSREGIFDSARISELVYQHFDRHANHSHFLWSLIVFEMWHEKYL